MLPTTLGFSSYLAKRTRDFTGRKCGFAKINCWIVTSNVSQIFIIGKMATAAWVNQTRDICKVYGQAINFEIENLTVNDPSGMGAFTRGSLDLLEILHNGGFDRIQAILINALEMAQQLEQETIVDLLVNTGLLLTPICFLPASRSQGVVLYHFEQPQALHWCQDTRRVTDQQDVPIYIPHQLAISPKLQECITEQTPSEIFAEWVRIARTGNFLYLIYLLLTIVKVQQLFSELATTWLGKSKRDYLKSMALQNYQKGM